MAEMTVAGMPLTGIDVPDEEVPIAAVVVLKLLNAEGALAYRPAATEGLSTVEALGMIQYAQIKLSMGLAANG